MPILNQRDYRLAKARIVELEQARKSKGLLGEWSAGFAVELAEVRRSALTQEYERLLSEIAEYEKLRGQTISQEKLEAVDLGLLPIVARISRHWSQRHLAELLDLKEQQVQRYETTRYSSVSLSRYREILEALGVELNAQFKNLTPADQKDELQLSRQLLREVQKRRWLGTTGKTDDSHFADLIRDYVVEAAALTSSSTFHRKKEVDQNPIDEGALVVWQSRVLKIGAQLASKSRVKFKLADMSWISELVGLSVYPDGPQRAVEFLKNKGIAVVIEAHLPQTRLDGAAMLLTSGAPVIGLTLRYDRLDYFWYTLLHELGHIFLHFNRGLEEGFIDDVESIGAQDVEREADRFAQTSLIPDEVWNSAPVRFSKSVDLAKKFAAARGIHVAIVAGRLRHERRDFSKLSELVGQGRVRSLFK